LTEGVDPTHRLERQPLNTTREGDTATTPHHLVTATTALPTPTCPHLHDRDAARLLIPNSQVALRDSSARPDWRW
jgi:hypothetical protein